MITPVSSPQVPSVPTTSAPMRKRSASPAAGMVPSLTRAQLREPLLAGLDRLVPELGARLVDPDRALLRGHPVREPGEGRTAPEPQHPPGRLATGGERAGKP